MERDNESSFSGAISTGSQGDQTSEETVKGALQTSVHLDQPARHGSVTFSEGSSEYDPTQTVKVQSACINCRKSRVKCNKIIPCARCLRLDLECKPQLRGRGRPPLSSTYSSAMSPKLLPVSSTQTPQVESGFPRSRKRPRTTTSVTSATAGRQPQYPSQQLPYPSYSAQSPVSPSGLYLPELPDPYLHEDVSCVLEVFNKLLLQGKVNLGAASSTAKLWKYIATENNMSWLLEQAAYISKLLNIDLHATGGEERYRNNPIEALYDVPRLYRMKEVWDTHDAAYAEETIVCGFKSTYCNYLFQQLFSYNKTAHDVVSLADTLNLCHPEDRYGFFNSIAEAILTNNCGNIVRHVLRLRVKDDKYLLAIVYYHQYTSAGGAIAHKCFKAVALPFSKFYSNTAQTSNLLFDNAIFSIQPLQHKYHHQKDDKLLQAAIAATLEQQRQEIQSKIQALEKQQQVTYTQQMQQGTSASMSTPTGRIRPIGSETTTHSPPIQNLPTPFVQGMSMPGMQHISGFPAVPMSSYVTPDKPEVEIQQQENISPTSTTQRVMFPQQTQGETEKGAAKEGTRFVVPEKQKEGSENV